ncbi:DUF4291 domain-containing protein [Deinococcus oregonensis]|uniref:DUF4291 domain-containing protein n=1 Tax=Deinococcus oregonensis TaxID=1805970 RepID=A0ABV6B125_9DEIO
MQLTTAPYLEQVPRWPQAGRPILAQWDESTMWVYQAFRPAIGHFAAAHGRFGGDYSFGRMSWIKPNFLWMMYRSGWGTKADQEVTLALRLKREGFETLLAEAVASSLGASEFATQADWKTAVTASDVRLQWDPDHDPHGQPLPRRAIQLGIRGPTLRRLNEEWLVNVQDISSFVERQRANLHDWAQLQTPLETPYPLPSSELARRIGADWVSTGEQGAVAPA